MLLQHPLCTPHFHTAHPIWLSPFPGCCSPSPSGYMILPHKFPFRFTVCEDLVTLLLDITNRAKRGWNSISFTHQVRIISKYTERPHLPCAVNELCVPAIVSPVGWEKYWMTLTTCQIDMIRSLSWVIVLVYLHLCLNHSSFSLVC